MVLLVNNLLGKVVRNVETERVVRLVGPAPLWILVTCLILQV